MKIYKSTSSTPPRSVLAWNTVLLGMGWANSYPYIDTYRKGAERAMDEYFARIELALDPKFITGPEEPKRRG